MIYVIAIVVTYKNKIKSKKQTLERSVAAYLKFLSDLGSIQEQPGAETVHWAEVCWKKI